MAYRLRIGYPNPGTYILTADRGLGAISGRDATLTYSGGGGASETVGSWASIDLSGQVVYRISESFTIPAWSTEGSTVTTATSAAWDGTDCKKITPLVAGTSPNTGQGDTGLGAFTFPTNVGIRKLNMRWEQYFGPDFITGQLQGGMNKWAILHSSTTVGGTETGERPMLYLSDMDTMAGDAPSVLQRSDLMAVGVASGTVRNFERLDLYAGYNYPRGNEDFYFGPTATTYGGKRVVPQSAWYTFEMEVISESTVDWPDGLIRLVVWNRAGEQLTDLWIPWNWDTNWTVGDYMKAVNCMGQGYMNAVTSPTANNYTYVKGLTFAANRPGLIEPRTGFFV